MYGERAAKKTRLFGASTNQKLLLGKSYNHNGKKSGKMTLPPLKKILLRPWLGRAD